MQATVGQVLVNQILPEEYRDYSRVWDKKTTQRVLDRLARTHPKQFKDIVHRLHQVGGLAAYITGHSVSLDDMDSVSISDAKARQLQKKVDEIIATSKLPKDRDEKLLKLLGDAAEKAQSETFSGLLKGNNPLAQEVASGARGNATQLNSLVGSPVLMLDHRDRPAPLPIINSFSRGLSPAEYWVKTYGTRKGAVATKKATADAGSLGKQLALAAHRLVVSDDEIHPGVGLPVDAGDPDNVGAVLAAKVGPYEAGTVITSRMLKRWPKGTKTILVRSPISDIAKDGGVPQGAAGLRELGGYNGVGEFIGIQAAQALSEKLSQGSLNVKHCITHYTPILYADWTTRRIDQVQPGDLVMGSDSGGKLTPVKVLNVFENGIRECWRTTFIRNGAHKRRAERVYLDSTLDHKLLATRFVYGQQEEKINGQIRPIPVGQKSRQFYAALPAGFEGDGQEEHEPSSREAFVGLKRIRQEPLGEVPTYDIEVDHPDHFFVLANGLIVSNSGGAGGKSKGGFKVINQLFQVPKEFPGGAAHAAIAGRVDAIQPAPQGGKYVRIGDRKHYVSPEQNVTVNLGQEVEAGDVLSDGLPNPAAIVAAKGVGEGRRQFVDVLRNVLSASGINQNRRNLELLARAAINHVQVTDESDAIPGAIPGDVVEYDRLAWQYKPRTGSLNMPTTSAKNTFLEKPVLHYSIGTKVTPSVVRTLKTHGIPTVTTHKDPPPFKPFMKRAFETLLVSPDWMERIGSYYVQKGLFDAVHRGGTADMGSKSYIPKIITGQSLSKSPLL